MSVIPADSSGDFKAPSPFGPKDAKWLAEISDYPISPGDLYIATYSKSGTMWTIQIVALIRRGGEKNTTHLRKIAPFLEKMDKESAFVRYCKC